ncbi:MAG: GTPase domain-containing protein [Hyphomicrobiaceae bacterium]|nr:GTPase domain-containing protein [Hyphomicrobiaceae bacterium]
MSLRGPASLYVRGAMLAVAVLLPLLSLVVLGSLWLWQSGYLLHWALAACGVTAVVYIVQLTGLRRFEKTTAPPPPAPEELPDAGWTPLEQAAWDDVIEITRSLAPAELDSPEAVLALGQHTVEAVARRLHPGEQDPLLRFTVPEALALVERVSGELRPFFRDNIPLGDQITVGQFIRLYGWRSMIDYAERAYDLWRIVRLLNPVSAATHEIRDQFSRRMYEIGREHIIRKLAERFVEEVGRAAIDLYGGRLRITPEELDQHVTAATRRDQAEMAARTAEPLRLLVAGQVNAGKSSLVNALSEEVHAAVDTLPATPSFRAYELRREGLPAALIIDSPGLQGGSEEAAQLIEAAGESDLIVWVVDASRADREHDRAALEEVRRYFTERPNRRRPPMLLVLSHIDRLRPFQEWSPPYDLEAGRQPKARSIRAAMETVGAELGFALGDIIPACLDDNVGLYNIDAVWSRIAALLPEAQRAQLVRRLGGLKGQFDWGRLWQQARNAGRVISRVVVR